jgi:septal ring factor EnvC (AmiA/AmiB activator)
MSEAIATREAVAHAVATLEANGSKVTVAAIKKFLGGGSQLAVTTRLREIRMGARQPATSDPYPESFSAAVDAFKSAAWRAARENAARSLEEERAYFLRIAAVDEAELYESAARIDALEAETARLEGALARRESEANELMQRLSEATARQQTLEQANDQLSSQNRDLLSKAEAALSDGTDWTPMKEEIRRISFRLHKEKQLAAKQVSPSAGTSLEKWRQTDIEGEQFETEPL